MYEDDEDKVRRNLVVFSAAIIAVAVFELPIADMARALVNPHGIGNWQLKSPRAWWAALAVLAYLWLRFHFSKDGRESVGKMIEAQSSDLARRQSAYLEGIARAAMAGEPDYKSVVDSIAALKEQHVANARARHPHHTFSDPSYDLGHSSAAGWRGSSTFNFRVLSVGGASPAMYNQEWKVDVPFSPGARLRLTLATFARAWLWSGTALVYFVPLGLAVIAAGVCVAKIAA
jgi:hypothetical protein